MLLCGTMEKSFTVVKFEKTVAMSVKVEHTNE